ncbi:MAG: alpha/beta fold hydrolase [Actinobacteria bacterium]|nr:alpha/beta fold hydrolase [Actinomycetota bacterium]
MDGLLLVHAFPLDARMWEPQLAAFDASGVAIVAPHLPGFGGTRAAPGGIMTMRSAAAVCLHEMDAAGLDRAVVCGLSMGGYVALELWRQAGERVVGLVLANTRAEADTRAAADRRRDLAGRLHREGNVLAASPPPLLGAGAGEDLWDRVRGLIGDQSPDAIAAAALGIAGRPDSTPDLPGIHVPTLVITGSADTLILPEATAAMADQIPGAALAVIEGAGHLTNLEAPEEFNRLLEEHLARSGLIPG